MTVLNSTLKAGYFPLTRPSKDAIFNLLIDGLHVVALLWMCMAVYVLTNINPEHMAFGLFYWSGNFLIAVLLAWNVNQFKRPIVEPAVPTIHPAILALVYKSSKRPDPAIHPAIPLHEWAARPRGHYVYIIQDVSNSRYFKIGRTSDLNRRLTRFGVILPITIHVVHLIPCENAGHAEAYLHHKFAAKRKTGEWFALNNRDVAQLTKIERL